MCFWSRPTKKKWYHSRIKSSSFFVCGVSFQYNEFFFSLFVRVRNVAFGCEQKSGLSQLLGNNLARKTPRPRQWQTIFERFFFSFVKLTQLLLSKHKCRKWQVSFFFHLLLILMIYPYYPFLCSISLLEVVQKKAYSAKLGWN